MKIHIANPDEPLQLGTDLFAICGRIVPKAQAEFFWNDSHGPDFLDFLNTFQLCRYCRRAAGPNCENLTAMYFYGLVGGQSLIDEQQNPEPERRISSRTISD